MLNPAKLTEAIVLADSFDQTVNSLGRYDFKHEGYTQGMAWPESDGTYSVERYRLGQMVGSLEWDDLAMAKIYVAAGMLGYWDELAELHPSNRK